MTTSTPWLELAWNQLWQLTAVIVVVGFLVALFARRRPHLAHALWLIVLVKALTPPVWTSRTGVFSWFLLEHEQPPAAAAPLPRPASPPRFAPPGDPFNAFLTDEPAESPPIETPPTAPAPVAPPPPAPWLTLPHTLAIAWCLGFAILAAVVGRKCLLLRRQLRAAPPAPPEVMQLVAELAGTLGHRRPPRVVLVDDALGPAALGLLRPAILVPRSLATAADPKQLSAIVAHELVHLRRRDPWIGLAQLFVQLLWWFHPLVWWSNRQMRRARELACDEETVARLQIAPARYAAALVELAAARKAHWTASLLLAMGREGITTRRVKHLLRPGQTFRRRTSWATWAVMLALAVATLPGAGLRLAANAPADQKHLGDAHAAQPPAGQISKVDAPTGSPLPEDLTPENQQKQHELLEQEYARVEAGFPEAHRQAAARLHERGARLAYGPVQWQGGRLLAGPPKIDDARAKTGVTLRSYDDATLADLRQLERLTTLIVETPVIKDDELAQLTSLRTLETLSIEIRKRGRVSSLQPPAGQKPLAMRGLGDLTRLHSLWSNVPITDEALLELARLPALVSLDVDASALTDEGYRQHFSLPPLLKRLELKRSALPAEVLIRVGRLTQLQGLIVGAADEKALAAALHNLPDLRAVVAGPGSDEVLQALGACKNLQWLTLYGDAKITDEGVAALAGLGELRVLYLQCQNQALTDKAAATLGNLKQLEIVRLNNTSIGDDGLAAFAGLPALRQLILRDCRVTGRGVEKLGDLAELRELSLAGCPLADDEMGGFGRLKQLWRLDLSRTPLGDAGVALLAELKQLENLNLAKTGVTDAALPTLRQLRPATDISLADTPGTTKEGRKSIDAEIGFLDYIAIPRLNLETGLIEPGHKPVSRRPTADAAAVEVEAEDEAKAVPVTGTLAVTPSGDPTGPPGVIAALREAGAYVAKWPTYDSDSTNPKPSVTLARPWQPTPEHALLLGRLGPVSAFNVMCQEVTPEALKQALAHIDAELLQLVEADADHLAAADGFRGRELTLSLVPDVTADILAAWPPLAMATELNAIKFAAYQVEGLRAAGKLSRLHLDALDASDEIVPIVASLRQLEHLHLVGSIFTDQGLAPLAKLTALTELYVGSREVERNPLQAPWLVPLVNLRRVQIDDMSDEALAVAGKLPHLERITLMGRSVTDAGLRALCESPSPRSLTIYLAEPFTAAGLKEIGRLWTLEALDINGNRTPIDDDVLAAWADLTRLRSLQLTRTQISSRGAQFLAGYKNLVVVELQGTNDLSDDDLAAFGQFTNLRSLSLGNELARVTDRGIAAIAKQSELREFKASGTQATEAGLASLARLPKLAVLQLADARGVTGAALSEVRDPLLLKNLSLAGTSAGDATLQQIARFKKLHTLNLSGTAVTDEGVKALAELPSLHELDLSGTKVTDAVLPTLDAMRQQGMQICDLSGTAVGATDRERFQPAYLRGRVVFPGDEDEVGVRRFDK